MKQDPEEATDYTRDADWMSQALAYMRSNSHRKIPAADVAGHVGRSTSWFQQQIRARTGRTFTAYLLGVRTEEARRLLAETSLPIGRIAGAVGFASATYFSRVFRREAGLSPRRYRDLHRVPVPSLPEPEARGERQVILSGPFSPSALGKRWAALRGRWEVRNGVLRGESPEDFYVTLNRDLPADFLLEFGLMRRAEPRRERRGAVVVALRDEAARRDGGYTISLGDNSNSSHRLTRRSRTMAMEQGFLSDGTWHDLRLRRSAGNMTLSLDGRELFRYRELAPLPNVESRRFVLGGWDATILLRRPRLFSLPSGAKTSRIALADEFMAEGDCARALEIYEAELERQPPEPEGTDLLFKLGMCFLGLGLKLRARNRLERFATRRRGDAWGVVARLESLRTRMEDLSGDDLEAETRRVLELASSPSQRDLLLDSLFELDSEIVQQGDFEKAILLCRLAYTASPPHSEHARRAAVVLGDNLFACYRYEEALHSATEISSSGRLNDRQVRNLRLATVPSLAAVGKLREAAEELRAADRESGAFLRAHADMVRAQVCQAQGDLEGALDHYLRLAERPAAPRSQGMAAAHCAAELLTLGGDWERAANLVATRFRGQDSALATILRDSLCVLRHAYRKILPVLEERTYGRVGGGKDTIRDNLLLCILHELTGEPERSAHNLEVLWRKFRKGTSRRWALPAAFLLGEVSEEHLWHNTRGFCLLSSVGGSSSLFYMLGLVMKSRGRRANAKRLFRLAAKADPLNYWPAILARRELGELTPGMKKFLATA